MLLRAEGIVKTYGAVRALKGISFTLERGEVHALVGENGAGKSTLIKILSGAEAADSGALEIDGAAVAHNDPRLARALGVAVIYQQPSLFPDLSVAENIALSLEPRGLWRVVDWKSRRARGHELLNRAGAQIDPERTAATLSVPEQQLVEIAKALGADPKILILDEPTSALSEVDAERLLQFLAVFRGQGGGVIYVSHRLDEVFSIADRITVLRDGETVATRRTGEVTHAEVVEMMAGREVAAIPARREAPLGEIALELREVFSRDAGLQNISLHVCKREVLGLAGLAGSGRTELAETIFGLRTLDAGEILVSGQPVSIDSPQQAIQAGIGYLPEDRPRNGIVLEMPITSNMTLASLSAVAPHGFIDNAAERELAQNYIGKLRIKAESAESGAGTLSGGNQQKVALARWLATNPSILILDEPTQGVDIASKSEIHRIVSDLAASGMAILLISSELEDILGMSDRIAVMSRGSIAGVLPRADAAPQIILSLALGSP